jgi:hypothetical protein
MSRRVKDTKQLLFVPIGQHNVHNDYTIAPAIDPPAQNTSPAITANNTQELGDIAIHDLFEHGTNAIIDVKIANLDSTSYRFQDPETR